MALRGFGIRIHQEADWAVLLPRQREVARIVEPDPVHFPVPEQALAQRLDLIAVDRKALLQHDLAHIGRVDRKPALTIDVHLGAAMLRPGDVTGFAERFVTFESATRMPKKSRAG